MSGHLILRIVGKFLIPFVLLFGLYVQFHGDYGPGGGFQAGVIFAAAFILHALLFGVGATARVAPPPLLRAIAAIGVLLYAGTGVASLLLGANFLDYDVLGHDAVSGQHHGILLVELGVGLAVASVMLLIFMAFAERFEPAGEDDEPETTAPTPRPVTTGARGATATGGASRRRRRRRSR